MCMCGGIIEVGLIATLVGYIGKKIHKCNCKCHSNQIESCNHCKENTIKIEKYHCHNKKKIYYKVIQYILGTIAAIGIGLLIFGVYDIYKHHEHEHHNNHIHNEQHIH